MEIQKSKYKFLMIEDDYDDALLIRDTLAESKGAMFSVEHSDRLQTGLERIATGAFDIVLLDLNLPDSIGLNTLERILTKVSEMPVIVLTGINDEAMGIRAVNMGAQDYLVKGFIDGNLLTRSIQYAIERHNLLMERKRADAALLASAQQWQTTFDAMNDAVCLMDIEGRIIRVNNAMSNLLGKPTSEIVGSVCWELVHGTSRSPEECPLMRMRETHHRESQVLPMNDRWFLVNVDPLLDEMDNIIGAVHIMSDITELEQTEELLKKSEEKYRSLVENLNDVIFTIDTEGYIIYISPVATNVFGYTPDEFIGKQFSQFVYPQDLPDLMSEFEQIMKGKLEPYEFRMLHKSSKIHYVRTSSRPVLENGQLTGMTGILTDITSQKQLEEQFHQAQKMEAIGRLAGGVAHDFNNLLQIITGYGEFVLSQLDKSDPMRIYIEEIKKAGEQASLLTRQLLAFSRTQMLKPQLLSIRDLVNNIGKMIRRLIGEDIELVTILPLDIIPVKADPGQIEQIIMNLAVNARDAMPEGGKLTIKTENVTIDETQSQLIPESQPGSYVCLSVSDTGTGMSKEVIQRIFEPFFSTKGTMGTGLGLSVVYGIVRQHDGWINVYSELEQGSVFKIYLPAISKKSKVEVKEEPSLLGLSGSGEQILMVEDEHRVREFVARLLQENGYVVFKASNAVEAMGIFMREDTNIQLVLSDVVLTDLNGLQLVDQLLTINPNLRVLFSSGYADQRSQWQSIHDKGYHFIQKPYAIADLLGTIKEIIKPN